MGGKNAGHRDHNMRGIPTGKPEGPLFHTGRGIVPGTGCATTYLEQRTFLCGIRADGRSSMRDKGFPEREDCLPYIFVFSRTRSAGESDPCLRCPDNRLRGEALAARPLQTFCGSSEDNGVFGENLRLVFLGAV